LALTVRSCSSPSTWCRSHRLPKSSASNRQRHPAVSRRPGKLPGRRAFGTVQNWRNRPRMPISNG
jgi:hypothetical protein